MKVVSKKTNSDIFCKNPNPFILERSQWWTGAWSPSTYSSPRPSSPDSPWTGRLVVFSRWLHSTAYAPVLSIFGLPTQVCCHAHQTYPTGSQQKTTTIFWFGIFLTVFLMAFFYTYFGKMKKEKNIDETLISNLHIKYIYDCPMCYRRSWVSLGERRGSLLTGSAPWYAKIPGFHWLLGLPG